MTLTRSSSEQPASELQHGDTRAAQDRALLELVLATSSVGVCLLDRELRYVRINEALAAMNGRSVEEHIGRTIHEVLVEPPEVLLRVLNGVFATGEPVIDQELGFEEPDGERRVFIFSAYPAHGSEGEVVGVACFASEVTRARSAEAALRASQRQLELAIRAGRLGTWHWEIATRRMHWSPMLEELHGIEPGTFDGTLEAFRATLHPDDARRVLAALESALAGTEREIEYRVIRKSGEVRWLSARGEVSRDTNGVALAVSGVCADITERKRVEREREFHVRAGELFGTVLDVRQALDAITRLAIPELADVAIAELFENGDAVAARSVAYRDGRGVNPLASFTPTGQAAAPLTRSVRESRTSVLLHRVEDAELSSLASNADQREELQALRPASWLIVPIVSRGRGIGALSLGLLDRTRSFQPHLRTLAEELVRRASAVLEKAIVYRAQRDARRSAELASTRLHQLQRATAALSHATTPEEVLRVLVRHALAATGATSAWVALPVSDETLELQEIGGAVDARQVDLLGGGDAPLVTVATTRSPLIIRTLAGWRARHPLSAPAAAALGLRSLIALPLLSGDSVRGAFAVAFAEEGHLEDDLRVFLLALAREAAGALDRALLFKSERDARARAERADRAKAEFLATMSHELRTPLSAILGFTALMADEVTGPINDRQRKQLMRVDASARHLLALIEEILSYGRLEAGREEAYVQEIDVAALTREAVSMVEPIATTQGLELTCDLPEHLLARTDSRMVRQILLNLLGNAVRYTPEGRIHVDLRTDERDVVWEVSDTGIGIEPAHQERIFTPFYQIDQSHTRRYGGTGLGLSVSRKLARLLGGDVTVRSAVGEGSVFTVQVPHLRSPPAGHGAAAPPARDGHGSP